MHPRIEELRVKVGEAYSSLTRLQRIALATALGVLVVIFFSTLGIEKSPRPVRVPEFKPYPPERRLSPPELPGRPGRRADIDSPVSLHSETGARMLEELAELRKEIDEFRSSMVAGAEQRQQSLAAKLTSALTDMRGEFQAVSSEIAALRRRKEDEREPTEQHVELIGVASSGGLHHAIVRTEGGDRRVTEGDRIGPWLVVEIEGDRIRLEQRGETRTLRLK